MCPKSAEPFVPGDVSPNRYLPMTSPRILQMNSDTCWPAVRERWRRPVVPDLYGILFASFYLTTAVVYFTLRITTTLYGLEHPVYARLVLAVEMAAAFNMLIFCLHRLVKTKTKVIPSKVGCLDTNVHGLTFVPLIRSISSCICTKLLLRGIQTCPDSRNSDNCLCWPPAGDH